NISLCNYCTSKEISKSHVPLFIRNSTYKLHNRMRNRKIFSTFVEIDCLLLFTGIGLKMRVREKSNLPLYTLMNN
ncbi:MAG TPA: hypothetical protein VIA09_07570, partial [Nitrososphaeraceae archaeon]